ncbi:hypothetical protein [Compostimonas suwonensis]|uniref:Uncharacterized protein n=1 Tax=Compostimonas suwonensis TaxID=1048394 RepID=A0A2M9BB38_9MICO|nr:hypothetical protein [Compostimonas suwonensis]PJJ55161.1 hypothetical protein CLV54_3501 [Compostimonas suwonensis]
MLRLSQEILISGLRDWNSLWHVHEFAEDYVPDDFAENPMKTVISSLQELLEGGYARVGQLVMEGQKSYFVPWTHDRASALAELRSEWTAVTNKRFGDPMPWLENTEKGNAEGRHLLSIRPPDPDADE